MTPWERYIARRNIQGATRRSASMLRETRMLEERMDGSLSYHHMVFDGEEREIAVLNSDNLNQKTICAMPGEKIRLGGMVEWMDNHWLVTSYDANDEIYGKGVMQQCNYLLRWVAKDNTIVERWCIVEDGTKYLTGEYTDNNYIMARGDSRIAITIAKDKYTAQLGRNNRFLVDDYDCEDDKEVLAYRLTKPMKLGETYGEDGVYCFVLAECNSEDTDNFELHIANYYDYFPKDEPSSVSENEETQAVSETTVGRKVWY